MNSRTIGTYIFLLIFFGFLVFSYLQYTSKPLTNKPNNTLSLKDEVLNQVHADIEQKIKDVINKNPEMIIKSLQTYHSEKLQQAHLERANLIKSNINELKSNNIDPEIGNKDAKIKIVDFFDYNCGYCKSMASIKADIIAQNKDVLYIFKELPILGETSVLAAKSALAVNMIDKSQYFAFHEALLIYNQPKTIENIAQLAVCFGIDRNKFIETVKDQSISEILANNQALARKIEIQGTPTYIINGELVNSTGQYQVFQGYIDKARDVIKSEEAK